MKAFCLVSRGGEGFFQGFQPFASFANMGLRGSQSFPDLKGCFGVWAIQTCGLNVPKPRAAPQKGPSHTKLRGLEGFWRIIAL